MKDIQNKNRKQYYATAGWKLIPWTFEPLNLKPGTRRTRRHADDALLAHCFLRPTPIVAGREGKVERREGALCRVQYEPHCHGGAHEAREGNEAGST